MEKNRSTNHLGYIDGMRGLAALFVVLHHAYLQVTEKYVLTGTAKYVFGIFYFGRYAVDFFIVLSGFCLMLPIVKGDGKLRGGALSFFKKRAWRILPTYYAALLFSWFMASLVVNTKTGTHWDISIPVTIKDVISHFFLVHDLLGQATINHAFWSIAVEWRIYFLFPLLIWLWTRLGGLTTTFFALIVSYLFYFASRNFIPQGFTAYYIGLFCLGMLGTSIVFSDARIYHNLRKMPWNWILFFFTLLVIGVSKIKIWHRDIFPEYIRDGVVGIWNMCFLIWLSQRENHWFYKFLSTKTLVFVGTFAYSLYLVHAPLLQVFWQYVFVPFQDKPVPMLLALFFVGTPVIIGFCYLFFLLCERPVLRRKDKMTSVVTKTIIEPAP